MRFLRISLLGDHPAVPAIDLIESKKESTIARIREATLASAREIVDLTVRRRRLRLLQLRTAPPTWKWATLPGLAVSIRHHHYLGIIKHTVITPRPP
jgi:hypothetical protein